MQLNETLSIVIFAMELEVDVWYLSHNVLFLQVLYHVKL